LGTKEYDCTSPADIDWDQTDNINEGEARLVKVELWKNQYDSTLVNRFWLNESDTLVPFEFNTMGQDNHSLKCECGAVVGWHVGLIHADYFCPNPANTQWVKYIEHGKQRKLEKKNRLKIHKKNNDTA